MDKLEWAILIVGAGFVLGLVITLGIILHFIWNSEHARTNNHRDYRCERHMAKPRLAAQCPPVGVPRRNCGPTILVHSDV